MSRRPGARFNRGRIATAGIPAPVLDTVDLSFRIRANDPATYTETAGTLTSLISSVSGTPLNATITGAPKILIDPRTNRPAFSAAGVDAVRGSDATMQAAATGSNRAWTAAAVIEVTSVTSTGYWFACNLSSGTHGFYFGQVAPNIRVSQAGPGGFISAASEKVTAGLMVITQRSPDGLTVYTSVNGAAETSVTVASHGLMSPDRTGVFESVGATPGTRFHGYLFEQLFYGVDKGAVGTAAIANYLLYNYRPAPIFYAVGDSITTAQNANNGGMVALVVAAARAEGMNVDPQGPTLMPNGSGGAVFAPYKTSAASGNTCAQMLTRVQSTTQGLGLGGGSEGYYRRARLVLLHAGTNDLSTTDYTSLLTEIGARLEQHGNPNWRIAVTTIPQIAGSEAGVAAFNAALPAIWDTFEVTYPGTLLRWDAFACNPSRPDGTHPDDAGYVDMVTTYGAGVSLYPTIRTYLASLQ